MPTESKSRRRRRKKILKKTDGSLFDATERRRITRAELRDYLRDGGLFEARRQENGADCTYEVLQSVVGMEFLQNLVPGLGSGSLAGLGGLGALTGGGGPLAGLGGAGGLRDLARLLGQEDRDGDRWDDWDEPSRRSPRRSEDPGWRDGDWAEPPSRRPHRHDDPNWATGSDWALDADTDADPDAD